MSSPKEKRRIELDRESSYPVYLQLADKLRARIQEGAWAADEAIPPERRLSRDSGLNHVTVRKSLRVLEEEGWIYRVRGKGTFVRRQRGRPLDTVLHPTVRYVGISVPECPERHGAIVTAQAAIERLWEERLEPIRLSRPSAAEGRERVERNRGLLSGLIVFLGVSWVRTREQWDYLAALTMPVVGIGEGTDKRFSAVWCDQRKGVAEAVRRFSRAGHRCIAFVHSEGSIGEPRGVGFRRAVRELGLRGISAGFESPTPRISFAERGYEATRKLFARRPYPTAVFAENDTTAVGVYRALHDLGICVPDEVEVIGSGDDPEAVVFLRETPFPISTVALPRAEMGQRAAELLMARIQNPELCPERVVLPTRLIHRQTTREGRVDARRYGQMSPG